MPIYLTDLLFTFGMIAAAEVTFRIGHRLRPHTGEDVRTQITTVEAAAIGLFALVLGFTLSMADTRFNARRLALVAEASAVLTTYQRTELLPPTVRERSQDLLREYVQVRRAYYDAAPDEVPATMAQAVAIHGELWTLAMDVAHEHPDWDVLALYVDSLAEVLTREEGRNFAINARVPATVYGLLALIAFVAIALTGYAFGLIGNRSVVALYVVPILIALAYGVILDLDRSRAGFLNTGDRPMMRVQELIRADRAATK